MARPLCINGKQQSPINLISKISKKCGATCDLTFFYRTSKCNVTLLNKSVILDYDNGSYVTFNHDVYELDRISFTSPSSHKIDNISYPLEAHIYHRSPNTLKVLVIAIFIDINDAISSSKQFLDIIINSIPKTNGEQISTNMSENWNIFRVIPELKSFYLYQGSIPRHPCTEDVTWIVMDEPVNCSEAFYDIIQKFSKNNARSIKKLNSRMIYYNPNTSSKTNKNYGSNMKCYTEKEFQSKCQQISKNVKINTYQNYRILIITIISILVVLTILFILWLFDRGFFINVTAKFNNVLNKRFIDK